MGYKRNCVWYDETRNEDYHLCYCLRFDNPFIEECPMNCGNYIPKSIKDEELRKKLFGKKMESE